MDNRVFPLAPTPIFVSVKIATAVVKLEIFWLFKILEMTYNLKLREY
jgi:hypothetical protein